MTFARPLPHHDPIALLRVDGLRAAETAAAASLPPHTLMARCLLYTSDAADEMD